jgi:hypothetical protein
MIWPVSTLPAAACQHAPPLRAAFSTLSPFRASLVSTSPCGRRVSQVERFVAPQRLPMVLLGGASQSATGGEPNGGKLKC